jgi:hypothetical protein
MTFRSRIGNIPVLGYVLKVLHDIVSIPRIRRDIVSELRVLEGRLGELKVLERRVGDLDSIERRIQELHGEIAGALRIIDDLQLRVSNTDTLAAYARKAERERSALRFELAGVRTRVNAVESRLDSLHDSLRVDTGTSPANETLDAQAAGS